MRFPRALSIRDDLTVADCATAKGADDSQLSRSYNNRVF